MKGHVYALLDPRDGSARYVGATRGAIGRRAISHHVEARRGGTADRHRWLRLLLAEGLRAIPILLEETPLGIVGAAEQKWCIRLREMGEPILNDRGNWGSQDVPNVWTPALDALLGIEHDSHVAALAGVTRKAAAHRREVLGIPATTKPQRRTPPPPGRKFVATPLAVDIIAALGTETDEALGERAGVSKTKIQRERRRRSIASCASSTGATGQFRKGHYPTRWLKKRQ